MKYFEGRIWVKWKEATILVLCPHLNKMRVGGQSHERSSKPNSAMNNWKSKTTLKVLDMCFSVILSWCASKSFLQEEELTTWNPQSFQMFEDHVTGNQCHVKSDTKASTLHVNTKHDRGSREAFIGPCTPQTQTRRQNVCMEKTMKRRRLESPHWQSGSHFHPHTFTLTKGNLWPSVTHTSDPNSGGWWR